MKQEREVGREVGRSRKRVHTSEIISCFVQSSWNVFGGMAEPYSDEEDGALQHEQTHFKTCQKTIKIHSIVSDFNLF
jgi:hypothetical protein